jgi:hypothetical protein
MTVIASEDKQLCIKTFCIIMWIFERKIISNFRPDQEQLQKIIEVVIEPAAL